MQVALGEAKSRRLLLDSAAVVHAGCDTEVQITAWGFFSARYRWSILGGQKISALLLLDLHRDSGI